MGVWHSSIRVVFVDGLPTAQETLAEIEKNHPRIRPTTNSRMGVWHSSIRVVFVDGLPTAQETLAEIEKAMMKDKG